MEYIRQVQVTEPGTHNQHIVAVRHSARVDGPLTVASRETMVNRILAGASVRTHNDRTGAEAPVVTATTSQRTRYLTTVANGRETDNLLNLPRF